MFIDHSGGVGTGERLRNRWLFFPDSHKGRFKPILTDHLGDDMLRNAWSHRSPCPLAKLSNTDRIVSTSSQN